MPVNIQNPDGAEAAVQGFGLKGRLILNLDETVVPVALIQDLAASPYINNPRPCIGVRGQAAGGAGVYSGAGVRPAEGVLLRVLEVSVENMHGAANRFDLRFVAPTQLASLATSVSDASLHDCVGDLQAANKGPKVASRVHAYTLTAYTNTVLVGRASIPANGSHTFNLRDRGLLLHGSGAYGIPTLIAGETTANQELGSAVFLCEEWRKQG